MAQHVQHAGGGGGGFRNLYHMQFYKTSLCRWYKLGKCTLGPNCRFAHGPEDRRGPPDLSATSLCPVLLKEGKCTNPKCTYAHSKEELRATSVFRKKAVCKDWLEGECINRDCRWAHGEAELNDALPTGFPFSGRIIKVNSDQSTSTSTLCSSSSSSCDGATTPPPPVTASAKVTCRHTPQPKHAPPLPPAPRNKPPVQLQLRICTPPPSPPMQPAKPKQPPSTEDVKYLSPHKSPFGHSASTPATMFGTASPASSVPNLVLTKQPLSSLGSGNSSPRDLLLPPLPRGKGRRWSMHGNGGPVRPAGRHRLLPSEPSTIQMSSSSEMYPSTSSDGRDFPSDGSPCAMQPYPYPPSTPSDPLPHPLQGPQPPLLPPPAPPPAYSHSLPTSPSPRLSLRAAASLDPAMLVPATDGGDTGWYCGTAWVPMPVAVAVPYPSTPPAALTRQFPLGVSAVASSMPQLSPYRATESELLSAAPKSYGE
ncbi:unnamed protein product [Vitrella brassicaformis CCMP3155]|uniref:C3H1-type domain-containing protein n=1 Tax=Vitrella brassicaformis (strain CCMP3155) TaxID=1169540 RepID=A0A0G4EH22_VITBC|nr:unnamed protein product [Vitrella brassicaformis CCMP3155]|eukprot:CEL94768.1 unnamed protein product [Vitrella brassicaformis CCMP3155]